MGSDGAGLAGRLRLERGAFSLDVELDAPARGITAVFGASGAGKSTLLRCVAGLERAARGWLRVGGEAWQDDERRLFVPPHRRPLGYVFQEAGLFTHLAVRGNLEYGLRRTPPADRRVSFAAAVEWLALGSLLERRVGSLSGGERQRVAIGRALLAGPRLLLMDEPLGALDAPARSEILLCLERLQSELAIPLLYVSHQQDEVLRLADHLVLLAAGRVRAAGALAEIATRLDLLPWTPEAEPEAVVEARVVGHDAEFELTYLDFAGGRLSLPRHSFAAGSRQRVRILARDVSLALERPARTSVLNVFPARILEIGGGVQPLVKLDAGGAPLLAQVTRKSLHLLALRPGLEVFAVVKGVALVV